MGWFSEPCWKCACPVKKSLRFCPKCGAPGPTAEFECYRCRGHNKGGTQSCGHCGTKLFDEEGQFIPSPVLIEKTWARQPEDIAARLQVQDVQGRFVKPVVIEEGTSALVFQDGRYAGTLPSGRYDHTSLLQRVASRLNLAAPAVFVLVDSADVELELTSDCLTTENLPVSVTSRIVIALKEPLAYFQNFIKSRSRVLKGELEESLENEITTALQHAVRSVSLHDLTGNLKLRESVLDILVRHLSVTLARYGLALVHVSSLAYDSKDLEALKGRAQSSFSLREQSLAAIRKAKVEAEGILGVDVRNQAVQEVRLKEEQRRQELERAREKGDVEGTQHAVAKKSVEHDYERDRTRKDQEQNLDLLEKKRRSDLDHWQQSQEAELALKQKKLAMYATAPPQALAAILEGSEFNQLMRVEELRAQQNMSPEQMLIFVAGKSPDVAHALAQKYASDGTLKMAQAEKIFADQKADLARQMSEKAMDRVADVAEGRARSSAIVSCPSCGRADVGQHNFCTSCGAKLKNS
jgi:hypothetical protein